MIEVTVTNVLEVASRDLAYWVNTNLLDLRLPQPDANSTIEPTSELVPLLSAFANRHSFATELYNIVVGELATYKLAKKSGGNLGSKQAILETYEMLTASKEILYRTLQTLSLSYEAASRMMTGYGTHEKFSRGRG